MRSWIKAAATGIKKKGRYSKQIYEVEKTEASDQINRCGIQGVTDDSKVSF